MSDSLPNMHDPDIRAMVLRDHQPEEIWSLSDYSSPGGREFVRCQCFRCGEKWPCRSIKEARRVEAEVARR